MFKVWGKKCNVKYFFLQWYVCVVPQNILSDKKLMKEIKTGNWRRFESKGMMSGT